MPIQAQIAEITPEQQEAARQALIEAARNPAAALSSLAEVSEAWVQHVDQQFATSLFSPIEAVRGQTMQDIIYIANYHSDKVTFKKVVKPLLNIYRFDENEQYRLMALASLHAVGDAYGMQRVRELVREQPSERVRLWTLAALKTYDESLEQ
ncbi:MAG: hypothetical protein ACE5G0_19475 [Rhodothermales bacterium]